MTIHGSPTPGHRSHVGVGFAVLVGLAVALVSAMLVSGARTANQASGLIAFARADGVYVMRADGTGVRRIMQTDRSDFTGRGIGIAWSPHGTKLAIATSRGIWLIDANGRNRVRVAAGGEPYWIGAKPYRKLFYPRATSFGSPTWSPDGRSIAFTAFEGVENRDIWVMNADGSGQHRLKKTPFWEGKVDWSPVGGWLVFDSGGYVSNVYVMKRNGTGLRLLTPGPGWVGSGQPTWSPDGQKVVVARPSGIWVINANGDFQVQLTHYALDEDPAWSSSRRIAFVRKLERRDASSEIYVINADGTGVTRLTHNRVGEANPAWQPIPPRHR